jgi:hypothetical protein
LTSNLDTPALSAYPVLPLYDRYLVPSSGQKRGSRESTEASAYDDNA